MWYDEQDQKEYEHDASVRADYDTFKEYSLLLLFKNTS